MVIWIIAVSVLVYLGISVGYLFVLSLAGRLAYRNPWTREGGAPGKIRKIAVLVPAYKEDGVIVSTAENLLGQVYPQDRYDVHILADSLAPGTIAQLRALPVQVWEVSFLKSTKTRSLNAFFRSSKKDYDLALVCDADNMLEPSFLAKVNRAFDRGARAVQGVRVPKNMDTPFAVLDACSEAIANHLFRQGANGLGLSCSVSGSGMAFEYGMLRDVLGGIDAVGGFDKILQLKLTELGVHIRYLDDALVFDEKVDDPQAFQQQRRRWVASQVINLRAYFVPGFRQLFKGNVSYFNLAVAFNIVLPRALLMVALPVFTLAAFFLSPALGWWGLGMCLAFGLTLALALPRAFFRRELVRAILYLPKGIWMMLSAVLRLRNSNKTFIHTVHTKTSISNNLFNQQQHGR
jgi:cellulose synthase/poly-beta-1,6-N-acetylglucosamine synthase-like glycosyltransferase